MHKSLKEQRRDALLFSKVICQISRLYGKKICDMNQILVILLGRLQLSNPSDWPCCHSVTQSPGPPFTKMVKHRSQHAYVLACLVKCGMTLLIHAQTSNGALPLLPYAILSGTHWRCKYSIVVTGKTYPIINCILNGYFCKASSNQTVCNNNQISFSHSNDGHGYHKRHTAFLLIRHISLGLCP